MEAFSILVLVYTFQTSSKCQVLWIGFSLIILKGVKIGKGVIIAACSVATKDIPEFLILA